MTLANHLTRLLRAEGGFTYNPRNGALPERGFVVAVRPPEGKDWRTFAPGSVTEADITQFVFDHFSLLAEPQMYVGGWAAEDRDALDIVQVCTFKAEAVTVAIERGQDAIFDLSTGEEVEVA